jgi:hypothetical protein
MAATPDRKTDAAAADDRGEFRVTEFGRRRVSKVPRPLRGMLWLVMWPFRFLNAKIRGARLSDPRP